MSKVAEVLTQLRNEQTRLRRELAQVERVIEALQEAMGEATDAAADADMNADAAAAPAPAARLAGPYASLTLYEATAAHLAACGKPQTAREIADALRAGGFKTRSANFANTVRTMLRLERYPGIRVTSDGRRWYGKD